MGARSANAAQTSSPRLLRILFTIHYSIWFSDVRWCDRQDRSGNSQSPKKADSAPAAEVSAIPIAPQPLPVTFEALGQTEGSREVEVRAVSGILLRRFYTEGGWVKRGTPLLKIDPAPDQRQRAAATSVTSESYKQASEKWQIR